MEKERIIGSGKSVKGKVKEAPGKMAGDAKHETERKAGQAEGKVQTALGGAKETLRNK